MYATPCGSWLRSRNDCTSLAKDSAAFSIDAPPLGDELVLRHGAFRVIDQSPRRPRSAMSKGEEMLAVRAGCALLESLAASRVWRVLPAVVRLVADCLHRAAAVVAHDHEAALPEPSALAEKCTLSDPVGSGVRRTAPVSVGAGSLTARAGVAQGTSTGSGANPRAIRVSLQATVMIGLDVSRSLAPQGPAYGVRQLPDVSGLGAGTEALWGQELRRDLWLSIERRRRCLRAETVGWRSAACSSGRPARRVCRRTRSAACCTRRCRTRGRRWRRRADGVWAASFADAVLAVLEGNVPEIARARHARQRPSSRGGVCALASLGSSFPLPRTARPRSGAQSARRFSSPPSWARGGYRISLPPLCPPRAVFRRSFVWTTGCREIGLPQSSINRRDRRRLNRLL